MLHVGNNFTLTIVLSGLDNAGKTTILKKFNGEDIDTISPTLGFNIKTLEHRGYVYPCHLESMSFLLLILTHSVQCINNFSSEFFHWQGYSVELLDKKVLKNKNSVACVHNCFTHSYNFLQNIFCWKRKDFLLFGYDKTFQLE